MTEAKKKNRFWLAIVWSLFAMWYVGYITMNNLPEGSTRFADTILGFILGTIVSTIINFYFGASDKDTE